MDTLRRETASSPGSITSALLLRTRRGVPNNEPVAAEV